MATNTVLDTLRELNTKVATATSQDAATTQLTTANGKLDTLHSDLSNVDTRVTAVNSNLGTIQSQLTTLHGDLDGVEGKLDSVNTNLGTVQTKQDTGNASVASIDTKVSTAANQTTLNTRTGDLTETAPASDTASSGINGRLQRLAQRITSFIAVAATEVTLALINGKLPSNLTVTSTRLLIDGSGVTQPVSGVVSTKTDLTPSAPAAATVGISSASAVAANANRKGLSIVNTSINRVSLGFGQVAVLNSGVTLFPGGTYTMDENSFDLGAVNAIASASSSNISVQEYT